MSIQESAWWRGGPRRSRLMSEMKPHIDLVALERRIRIRERQLQRLEDECTARGWFNEQTLREIDMARRQSESATIPPTNR